jgi:hypothetical protein
MERFCKLFDSERYGQLLLMRQESDHDGMEIRCFAQPPGLGVCSVAIGFGDTDAGDGMCDEVFDTIDQAAAERMVKQLFDQVTELTTT